MTNSLRAMLAATVLLAACSPSTTEPAAAPAAQTDLSAATLTEAMQADRDFAAAVKANGPAKAFAEWFDPEDGQFIAPGVVTKGAAQVSAGFGQSPPDFTIAWEPDGGHASSAGDMAVTTGRYAIKAGGQEIEKGRYVTSWRKRPGGTWKAIIDTGVADPPAAAPAAPN